MDDDRLRSSPVSRGATGPTSTPLVARGFLPVAVLVICVVQLVFAAAGLLANPSFATGSDATSVLVLGVDFNGWHALAGFALFAPGVLAARRPELSLIYALTVIAVLLATAAWTLFDTTPAGTLSLPHVEADVIFHVGSAALFGAVVLVHLLSTGDRA